MAIYKYKPIDLNKPSARRLLRLFRGGFIDEIQCELFEGWINQSEDGMTYHALSYTWGSTEKTAQITVNGSTMDVTSNLHAALKHIRSEEEDRVLWIDAICIDQNNVEERNHQVHNMCYLYKEADSVLIWLGEGTQESDLVMDSIKRLEESNIEFGGDLRYSAQLWMYQAGIDCQYDKLGKGMEQILRRPWFRRIWILQEIANARAATVHCGKKSVLARSFAQFPSIIGLQSESHSQAVLDIMPGRSRKESWWGQNRNLHTLLVKFRESEATEERDIIYALLGISSDARLNNFLLPDYTKPLQQVIRDTTSFLLSHTDQDQSLYKFLHWTLPEFLQSLDSLCGAVFESASENGQEAMVELLLATNRVELNSKDKEGQTLLHRAACNGHDTDVRLLLEKGEAEADLEDSYGRTPLSQAARNGHELVVKLLLEKGVKLESRDSKGWTPLWWAASSEREAVIQLLLEKGANLESRDYQDYTPLSWAASSGHEAVIRLLLEKGAELGSRDNEGRTPLSWAALSGHEVIIQLLLEKGAELESRDNEGRTPLSWAASSGHEAVIQLLLKKGAEVESRDNEGRTPLSWAASSGLDVIIQLLLKKGAEVESRDNKCRTPLSWAASSGHEDIIQLLLENGAKLESRNIDGRTPLSWAASSGHKAIIQLMLKKGVELELRDNEGQTPLSWAALSGREDIIQLLLENGAKLELRNILKILRVGHHYHGQLQADMRL